MPSAPSRFCSHGGGCKVVVPGGGRCQKHARPTAYRRGYTPAWAEYSRGWLTRFPWCGMRQDGAFHMEHSRCAQLGLQVPATCTDHIVSMALGGSQFDPANHQSLCAACNARKAIALEGAFGR